MIPLSDGHPRAQLPVRERGHHRVDFLRAPAFELVGVPRLALPVHARYLGFYVVGGFIAAMTHLAEAEAVP
jgi:hypothetical protein